jgi:hypothetical protein
MKGAVREAGITGGCHIEALYTLRHFNREAAMRLFVVLVLSLVTFLSPAFAQITSATISGTIKDETGGVLPGVGVASKSITVSLARRRSSTSVPRRCPPSSTKRRSRSFR